MTKVFLLFLFFMNVDLSFAQPNECVKAKEVLLKYMALDREGVLLSTNKMLEQLIDYQGGDLPGYDSFRVVKNGKIISCDFRNGIATLKVSYLVLGTISGENEKTQFESLLKKMPHSETNEFQVGFNTGAPKILSKSIDGPHLSAGTVKKRVSLSGIKN